MLPTCTAAPPLSRTSCRHVSAQSHRKDIFTVKVPLRRLTSRTPEGHALVDAIDQMVAKATTWRYEAWNLAELVVAQAIEAGGGIPNFTQSFYTRAIQVVAGGADDGQLGLVYTNIYLPGRSNGDLKDPVPITNATGIVGYIAKEMERNTKLHLDNFPKFLLRWAKAQIRRTWMDQGTGGLPAGFKFNEVAKEVMRAILFDVDFELPRRAHLTPGQLEYVTNLVSEQRDAHANLVGRRRDNGAAGYRLEHHREAYLPWLAEILAGINGFRSIVDRRLRQLQTCLDNVKAIRRLPAKDIRFRRKLLGGPGGSGLLQAMVQSGFLSAEKAAELELPAGANWTDQNAKLAKVEASIKSLIRGWSNININSFTLLPKPTLKPIYIHLDPDSTFVSTQGGRGFATRSLASLTPSLLTAGSGSVPPPAQGGAEGPLWDAGGPRRSSRPVQQPAAALARWRRPVHGKCMGIPVGLPL